jgi:hypothetical protein
MRGLDEIDNLCFNMVPLDGRAKISGTRRRSRNSRKNYGFIGVAGGTGPGGFRKILRFSQVAVPYVLRKM